MRTDEKTLVEACVKRDEKACAELYNRYAPMMLGICMRYARSKAEAQDVLHDGFLKVFSSLDKLQSSEALGSWIRTIMVRTAITTLRTIHDMDPLDECTEGGCEPSVDFDNFSLDEILHAIQSLPPRERLVFNLREIEGYEYAEIAVQLGVQPQSVRPILTHAKKHLVDQLRPIYGGTKRK